MAGLGAALASPLTATGKKKKNKNKKKCDNEKKQCRSAAEAICAEEGEDEQECLDALLPCCATCNSATTLECVVDIFLIEV